MAAGREQILQGGEQNSINFPFFIKKKKERK